MRVGLLYFADEAGAPGRALKRLDGRSFSDPALRHVGAIMQRNREVSRRGVATAPPKRNTPADTSRLADREPSDWRRLFDGKPMIRMLMEL